MFYDDARELPEPPYPAPIRLPGVTYGHRCRLEHDWPAIDAAMEAAEWFKIAHNHDGVGGGDGTND